MELELKEANPVLIDNEADAQVAIKTEPQKCCLFVKKNLSGFSCAIISSIFLVFSNLLVKKTSFLNGFDQLIIRYFFQLIVLLVIALYKRLNLLGTKDQRKYLVIRGVFGAIGLECLYVSIRLVKPSDTTSLFACNVIFIAIISRIYLKEKFTVIHVIALVFIVVGVIFITQPSFIFAERKMLNSTMLNITLENSSFLYSSEFLTSLGIGLALFSGCCFGTSAIFVKQLAKRNCHFTIVNLYASYFGLPVGIISSIIAYYSGIDSKDLSSINTSALIDGAYSVISAFAGNFFLFQLKIIIEDFYIEEKYFKSLSF